jgi:hypothetical protein
VRLSNIKNILSDLFDKNIPFGLIIKDGKILSVDVATSNCKYLSGRILSHIDSAKIILNQLIIQKKEYVDFEILYTHKTNVNAKFQAIGKIAGIDELLPC